MITIRFKLSSVKTDFFLFFSLSNSRSFIKQVELELIWTLHIKIQEILQKENLSHGDKATKFDSFNILKFYNFILATPRWTNLTTDNYLYVSGANSNCIKKIFILFNFKMMKGYPNPLPNQSPCVTGGIVSYFLKN